MFTSTKNQTIWAGVLLALTMLFIWGNSALSGEQSSLLSDEVGGILTWILGWLPENAIFVIRKLGHFSEFTLLGFLLSWNARLYGWSFPFSPLLWGVMTAMTDESIQLFSPGRASSVVDVWIDFGGVLFGTLILWILFWFFQKYRRK